MITNQLVALPSETIIDISNFESFKIIVALDQSFKGIQVCICEKKIWEQLCEQHGLNPYGNDAKIYFREHGCF